MSTVTPVTMAGNRPFATKDRVRHHRRGWYGTVIEDAGADVVLVRFDDGTPHAWIKRSKLRLVEEFDAEVMVLVERLRALRGDLRFSADEVATIDRTMEALALALSEHRLRVRVAAEIDRLSEQVMHEPFEPEIARAPRVRQRFAEGARWALQQLHDRAHQERQASIGTEQK